MIPAEACAHLYFAQTPVEGQGTENAIHGDAEREALCLAQLHHSAVSINKNVSTCLRLAIVALRLTNQALL